LLEDGNSKHYERTRGPPLCEYSVSLRRVSGSGTQVSSLEGSNTPSSKPSGGTSRSPDEITVAMMAEKEEEEAADGGGATMEDVLEEIDNEMDHDCTAVPKVAEDRVREGNEEVSNWIGRAVLTLSYYINGKKEAETGLERQAAQLEAYQLERKKVVRKQG
jgi:seryl-tRNA synthetase